MESIMESIDKSQGSIKATVLAESSLYIIFSPDSLCHLMSTDVSQVGVALPFSLTFF